MTKKTWQKPELDASFFIHSFVQGNLKRLQTWCDWPLPWGIREPWCVAAEPGSLQAHHFQQLEVEILQISFTSSHIILQMVEFYICIVCPAQKAEKRPLPSPGPLWYLPCTMMYNLIHIMNKCEIQLCNIPLDAYLFFVPAHITVVFPDHINCGGTKAE